jgi:acyl-coenzyme A synthetase/AMP-(fatty) acid ligase
VADVGVAGEPHPEWGQQVVAYVVPATIDDPPTLEELRDWTRERVTAFKAPRRLVLVGEIPRTSSGKRRRHRLAASSSADG